MKNKFNLWLALQIAGLALIILFWCVVIAVAAHFVLKHW